MSLIERLLNWQLMGQITGTSHSTALDTLGTHLGTARQYRISDFGLPDGAVRDDQCRCNRADSDAEHAGRFSALTSNE